MFMPKGGILWKPLLRTDQMNVHHFHSVPPPVIPGLTRNPVFHPLSFRRKPEPSVVPSVTPTKSGIQQITVPSWVAGLFSCTTAILIAIYLY